MTTAVASLEHASKRFGAVAALTDVSFEIPRGGVVALLGANGAGKTTAISLLLGLRRPDSGTARLFGADPRQPKARRKLGCTPQEAAFPTTLRVEEVLRLVAAHFDAPTNVQELVTRFGLDGVVHRQTGGLSGGERRRLALALAFVGAPELLVLDEPTTGLDVEARATTWAAFRDYVAEGGTILLTTHYLEEAEELATSVVVIDRGRVRAAGTVGEVKARAGRRRVRFRSEPLPRGACSDSFDDNGSTITIRSVDPSATVRALVLAGARLDDLTVEPLPLAEALQGLASDEDG